MESRGVRQAIWILLMLVFMGHMLIWFVLPTKTYRQNWMVRLRKETGSSTYFGSQGVQLTLFMFPVLFIAVLGCICIHLSKKSVDDNSMSSNEKKKTPYLASLRQPILVKGPLGIVSSIELVFFSMFIALLVWSFAYRVQTTFTTITPQSVAKHGIKMWEEKLENSGLFLGLIGNVCLAFLFYPVTRASSVLPIFGLTSEASIKYHIWLGNIMMTLFTAHGLCYITYWAATNNISEVIKWAKVDISNVAGEISLLAGLALWVTTIPRIRRKMFEIFFYTHYCYILFMLFFVLHVGISYAFMALPGFYLFLVDRYLRFLQSRQRTCLVSARVLPCNTIELNFSKTPGLKYNPTSIMFLNIPSISKLQWHPFTISSNSNLEPERISVIIKSEGRWTQKLYETLSSPASADRLEASVEGPYGPISTNFLRHDTLVMVSGGSGITPFISIIREFIFMTTTMKIKTPQIMLICAFKNSSDLTMLDLLLPISGTPSDLSNLNLQVEAYVTREQEPNCESKKQMRTLWFKPNRTDKPLSAILGPNSWLWLGAILSVSFVMFLLFIGIITRYHIYPIDHNTRKYFSWSSQAILNILIMCISIGVTASAAFLWTKSHNAKEAMKIQNMEGATPTQSPGLPLYNGDRELESLTQQSLLQTTNVHFGQRPNLKRMLLECKGSSVGVLVCGPKKMRHDVAAICSSGLAENLHFESISFNW